MVNTPDASPAAGFLSSHFHVIPGEDPAEFDALVRSYLSQFIPQGPAEGFFLQTMVLCDWAKRRLTRWETQALRLFKPYEDGKESPTLKSIVRQRLANDRSYFRAYQELRKLQQERSKSAPAAPKPESRPQAKAATANAAPQSPQIGGIGFVSQKESPAPIPHIDLTGRTYKAGLVFVG